MRARKDSRQPTFNGSFDGAHHAIVNLSIATNDAHAGLFGMLGEDVEVKDLVFARPTIQVTDDNQFVGVLAGESTQDNISNVHVFDGQIAGEADATIGGIVGGSFLYTNFNDCSFQGNINTPEASPVGGIVGRTATSTKITACASNAEITGYSSVGGIAGSFSANDTINDCHATGKLVQDGPSPTSTTRTERPRWRRRAWPATIARPLRRDLPTAASTAHQ